MSKPWRPIEPEDGSPAITLTKSDGLLVIKQGDNVIQLKGMQAAFLCHSLMVGNLYEPLDK